MAILEQASVLTDAIRPVPAKELDERLERFRKLMDARHPDWEMAVISHKVAMYYFTGTMQEGALIIRRMRFCGCGGISRALRMSLISVISVRCGASARRRLFIHMSQRGSMLKQRRRHWTG